MSFQGLIPEAYEETNDSTGFISFQSWNLQSSFLYPLFLNNKLVTICEGFQQTINESDLLMMYECLYTPC